MKTKETKMENSPYTKGLTGAVRWQRGTPLPTPSKHYTETQIRDWVRGWNVGVASGKNQI